MLTRSQDDVTDHDSSSDRICPLFFQSCTGHTRVFAIFHQRRVFGEVVAWLDGKLTTVFGSIGREIGQDVVVLCVERKIDDPVERDRSAALIWLAVSLQAAGGMG